GSSCCVATRSSREPRLITLDTPRWQSIRVEPALRDSCRVRGYLDLAQCRVIFAGSTFRREKMRSDLFTGRSITAQTTRPRGMRKHRTVVVAKIISMGAGSQLDRALDHRAPASAINSGGGGY